MLLVNYKPLLSGHRLSGIAGSAWLAPLMSHDQLCLPGVFRRALLVPAPLDEVTHGHRDRALTPLQTIHIVFLQNRIGCLNDTRRINREITSNKRKKKKGRLTVQCSPPLPAQLELGPTKGKRLLRAR